MDEWKLIEVEDVEWQQDKSGFYCVLNVLPKMNEINCDNCQKCGETICGNDTENFRCFDPTLEYCLSKIRLDILTSDHSPAISFQGTATAVRKHVMRYAEENGWDLSYEHIAYIGYELARAEMLGSDYIQD